MSALLGCIERGTTLVREDLKLVGERVGDLKAVWALVQPDAGSAQQRRAQFDALAASHVAQSDPIRQHMGRTMLSFAPGLFAGGDDPELPQDNLDLERTFRRPKGHERRIHGHAHAGARIVQQGPTLIPVLDAHLRHPAAFTAAELSVYANAPLPDGQIQSEQRRKIMRLARSSKRRPELLADLEERYRGNPET